MIDPEVFSAIADAFGWPHEPNIFPCGPVMLVTATRSGGAESVQFCAANADEVTRLYRRQVVLMSVRIGNDAVIAAQSDAERAAAALRTAEAKAALVAPFVAE